MRKILLGGVLFWGLFVVFGATAQHSQPVCQNYFDYEADEGDSLHEISEYFGSSRFKELIKASNIYAFSNSNTIDQDMVLKIPNKVFNYHDSDLTVDEVLNQPFCDELDLNSSKMDTDTIDVTLQKENVDTSSLNDLDNFRSAFESLVNEQRSEEQEELQAEAEQQIFVELDGLVTDETRSKIGRDFYDIFYQQWEAPPNSSNFTIVISEQPTPSLGSLVSVSVNDEQIFRYRLQPRYEVIEQVATYAVRYTQNYMEENKHQYKIY
ncbi:MAG: CsgE family curli-type amyloid fiber assembly protein [Balneolaceae bacterium]|nr:CsgE family curli-type amyloid fiber assembly protein [Balneolaceae bacterium]MDR9408027.1 CsgE family curli-type amyloid fiber assembly protein [Balneolaceae bacterium]